MSGSDSEHGMVPDSASKCGTVLDSARERDMDTMALQLIIDLCDVTRTNYGKFRILLMIHPPNTSFTLCTHHNYSLVA